MTGGREFRELAADLRARVTLGRYGLTHEGERQVAVGDVHEHTSVRGLHADVGELCLPGGHR